MSEGPDPLQIEVARVVLAAAHPYRVALGGGLALVLHGAVHRPTKDVDVFSDVARDVVAAARLVEAALRDAGFEAVRVDDGTTLVDDLDDYVVEWELRREGRIVRLSLSCQARRHATIGMEVGPVMDLDDLLAWKTAALVGRARERDYIDVAAFLDRFPPDRLLAMARQVDPGLEDEDVPRVGRRLDRLPDEAFFPYELSAADVGELRRRFAGWPR